MQYDKVRISSVNVDDGKYNEKKKKYVKYKKPKITKKLLLEKYRKSNVMTKKDMANVIGVSLRLYESISYGNNISTRCAKKLKEFLNET